MSGPNKPELERFYAAFGSFVERCPASRLHHGLAELIELSDKITAAGALRRPTGRPRIASWNGVTADEVLPG